jgi:hypothetical protein
VKLLLDGQQRVTSLYGLVRGHAPEFFQGNAKAFLDLYFNLKTETFEFYGPVKMRDDPFWISVTDVFQDSLEDLLGRLANHVEGQPILIQCHTRLGAVRGILDTDLHVEEITGKDRTIDEVVEIFNRVNSGGTKLSAGDLALARICADWPGARGELARMLTGWRQSGFEFKQEWLLRCATAVATNQAPFSSLRTVSVDEFATALKKAEQAINFLLNLAGDRLGIDHDRVLAGRGAFAVLSRFVSDSGGRITDHQQQQKLLFWYIHSLLWGRYSGSTESALQRDLEALSRGGLDGLIRELDRWRGSLVIRPEDFDGWSVGARFYPMLYVLSRAGGARDLGNGLQLSAGMLGTESQLHLHHIFPKALLYGAGYTMSQVNALANLCFLTAHSNLRISASDPAEYLPQVEENQPGVLASQWIPTDTDLWKVERFQDFLAARRALLAAAANQLLNSLADGTAAEIAAGAPPRPGPGPAEADSDLVEIKDLAARLGIADPELYFEIVDQESGELLAMADLAWPEGIQPGRTQPVAFLLQRDEEMETRLGELDYRFFVEKQHLLWYLENTLGVDIDGDMVIGEVDR